ncbi:MAG: arsenical pump-driving ATPase [Propionibacteriaceae bacterium]|nr:arsenical pump-driving ATPase [Propionibacteriaceae bacterium]
MREPVMFLTDGVMPRFVFFTGKGGVGKTSLACATAVSLTDQGKRVLLVSTDPASNIGQVFDTAIGNQITPINNVNGLDALEIDPQAAAEEYRQRIITPVRGLLPEAEIASMTEQLSGSCTTEIAAFDEFTALLADPAATAGYDHVVFDTAPTGHTLRMLSLPGSWTKFLDDGKGDASCLGPLAGLEKHHETYTAAVKALTDPEHTALVLVARAQPGALGEAARTVAELADIGIDATHLIVNAVMPATETSEPLAVAIRAREQKAIANIPAALAGLETLTIPLNPANMVGVPALRSLLATASGQPVATNHTAATVDAATEWPSLSALVDELSGVDHGLVMCMGKGGVGKTTVAVAVALALAARGKDVHLTTTDPAGHFDETMDAGNLTVSRIDPEQAVREYRERVMATKGATLDEPGRAVLAEDLMSPCTEEIAVFERFADAVAQSDTRIVVMDTAPTGHTVLLMDATGSYHREMVRHLAEGEQAVTPLLRLQDGDTTRVIVVALPETTPVLEAEQLTADLARADIHPWAWVVNQSLAAAHPATGLLAMRAAAEPPLIQRVQRQTPRLAVVAMLAQDPATQPLLALGDQQR